ncbi:MAG: hypothetical protein KZQ76_12980 [Candidatus Thiodiazotropha sp. (ex Epidulcina cf. delphinae)]|nr:hypothetical protein [Candidatus Thiodiazotropha sp. (ex Epidulcina cf. delphinae)]
MVRGFRWFVPALAIGFPAISVAEIWHDLNSGELAARGFDPEPFHYRALRADIVSLRQVLSQAPPEFTTSQGGELALPMPYGAMQRFLVEDSPVMDRQLASRYPGIGTYRVRGVDEPASSGRIDLTPNGFHAMLTTPAGTVFIDPDGKGGYRSYYRQDYAKHRQGTHAPQVCRLDEAGQTDNEIGVEQPPFTARRILSGAQRRIYRLAVAATGEYTAYFGGSVTNALGQIVTAINRVNQIYGRDMAIQFQLVGNNDRIIYTDPGSDPYTHSSSTIGLMLTENQRNLDFILGADHYDIGHLFGTVGGGLASVGSVCRRFKAQAYTGTPIPDDDVFYIDFVAHELGHQLGATHSFNGTTANCRGVNRDATAAMEPGSGSTIMSYAGICGEENLQANSDPTFHAVSIGQMHTFIASGEAGQCGSVAITGNNAPSVDVGSVGEDAVYAIPVGTPFMLNGAADDADGDSLSYQWDEMDAGGEHGATDSTTIGTDIPNQNNPLFRSYLPKGTPERYFPRLSRLVSGQADIGETLPQTDRVLNFRLTVRDGESGVVDDDLAVQVDSSQGPFLISGGLLNRAGTFAGGTLQPIEWATAGTEQTCPIVEIALLSLSEGNPPATYCDMNDTGLELLALGGFPNTGSASFELPDINIRHARVMLSCADNLFFDLSDADFQISGKGDFVASDCKRLDGENLEHGTVFNDAGGAAKFDSPGGGGALLWLTGLLSLLAFLPTTKKALPLTRMFHPNNLGCTRAARASSRRRAFGGSTPSACPSIVSPCSHSASNRAGSKRVTAASNSA